ncbi:family 18 glycosyl hydrolase [Whalleya microplaca]|nr:family 18 glycosyl hydrolase [Whalleya microplaca]
MRLINNLLVGIAAACSVTADATGFRNVGYMDEWHVKIFPPKDVTAGITHVILAFAPSNLSVPTNGSYAPFSTVEEIRAGFDKGTQLGLAIGGWGDTGGFSNASKTDESRKKYGKDLAALIKDYDFVDIDWEYPGGNGADYKEEGSTNEDKKAEIEAFPLLLREIKEAVKPKYVSVTVPGLQQDMIAFTKELAPSIFESVEMVNVMTYDLMNRRDNKTTHQSSVAASNATIHTYMDLGLAPAKINLGLPYYAKFFTTSENTTCDAPVGCPIEAAEDAKGVDTGTSGSVTFEEAYVNPPPIPGNLTVDPGATCGTGTFFTCKGANTNGTACCSVAGYCGDTDEHCGSYCQVGYGDCKGKDIYKSFRTALDKGQLDKTEGGMWYWDKDTSLYWTWDTDDLIAGKFKDIIEPLGLGGVMAWSLGQDSADWKHIKAATKGAQDINMPGGKGENATAKRELHESHKRYHAHQRLH